MTIAAIAYAPRLVQLGGSGYEADMEMVERIRPRDFSAPLWELLVQRRASRVVASEAFKRAYVETSAAVEEALGERR